MNPTISVLICTRNRPDDVAWALPSVLSNVYPNYEVILVDQSDGYATRDVVTPYLETHPNFHYIPTETRGVTFARNIAISYSTSDVIAFTDDDCVTAPDWVSTIAKLFSDAELDVVFGQVHMPEVTDPTLAVPCLYFTGRRILRDGRILGMTANMAFRRSLIDKIGCFDTLLGPGGLLSGGEEFDFSYRAQRVGAMVVADSSLVLIHRATRTQDEWKRVCYLYGIGDAAFYAKHARCGDWWAARVLCQTIVRRSIRSLAKTMLRRNSGREYVVGLLHGLVKSRKFKVDRDRRLYITVEETSTRFGAISRKV